MKRFLGIILVLVMTLTCVASSLAQDTTSVVQESVELARESSSLGSIGFGYTAASKSDLVNVRKKPDPEAGTAFRFPCGLPVDIIGQDAKTDWYIVALPNGGTGYMSYMVLTSVSFGDTNADSCSYVIGTAVPKSRICGYRVPNATSASQAMDWMEKGVRYSVVGERDGYSLILAPDSDGLMYVKSSNLDITYLADK